MDAPTVSSLLRQRLATSGEVTLRAGGLSMLPAIPPGARLHVVPLGPADPRLGRVYLFELSGGLRAHRFMGADAKGLRFRGDNARRDEVVPADALVGAVDALLVLGHPLELASPFLRAVSALAGAGLRVVRALVPDRVRDRLGGALRRRLE